MNVILNGERREFSEESTVADAVAAAGGSDAERGVAVAVDGEVLPRREWTERVLSDGENVEVVHAVQGG